MIWRCHSILCFHFYFLFRNNGIREQLYQNDFCCCYGEFFFESVIPQVLDHSYVQSSFYKTPWQWYMKDTLQLKILPTSTNVGVKPALRHLTYCNFCHNLFTFLCLKDVPPLINFSNVFQSRHSYSNPPTPLPLPPLFSIKH